jgi:hypothetical protein
VPKLERRGASSALSKLSVDSVLSINLMQRGGLRILMVPTWWFSDPAVPAKQGKSQLPFMM